MAKRKALEAPYPDDAYADAGLYPDQLPDDEMIPPEEQEAYQLYLDSLAAEEQERHVGRLRIASWLTDFLSVMLGVVVTVILLTIFITLLNWVIGDVSSMLRGVTQNLS